MLIDEGTVVEAVGTEPGWDTHYAREMSFATGCSCDCLPCQSCDHK